MKWIETIASGNMSGYSLQGTVIALDNDDLIVVLGGGKDHIGALALAVPRPSLQDQNRTSATSSILTMLGHKDDELAKYASERLAAATGRNIAVIAGVHFDNLTSADLEILQTLWVSLTEKIIFFINQK